ncbi:enoyl-CoA hydratase [Rhizoctonia solani 123E]|uniref:Enoyl-CoA hydratase n=1 Tax=Rhizoctonia solani 123E TaxID=1423351 RepID=A0A074SFZ1_9AGAM|nr:enoyl-CoA hydratase [Rhizoctonia solani 123E]
MLLARVASTLCFAVPRSTVTPTFKRLLNAPAANNAESLDAFLEPVDGRPGVSYLSLNRPKARNAISVRMLDQIKEALETAQKDKTLRTLIVRSTSPGAFCAGADLVERKSMSKEEVDAFLANLRAAFCSLEDLPIPTIAAIDGPALGGGLEMALCCDLRVSGSTVTKIGLPETRLGIIPGAGGTQRAVRLLGLPRAKALVYTGRALGANEALSWGVVDYVSNDGQSASERALELAEEMSNSAPLALRAAKRALSFSPDLSLAEGLDLERACYEPLLSSKDRTEALAAFQEKRKPVFKGE